jgi:hypothetical protein
LAFVGRRQIPLGFDFRNRVGDVGSTGDQFDDLLIDVLDFGT